MEKIGSRGRGPRKGFLAVLLFAAALLSCGGGQEDTEANESNRVKAAVTAPQTFFPNIPIPSDANTRGMWSPVYSWPGVAVHAVVLPD